MQMADTWVEGCNSSTASAPGVSWRPFESIVAWTGGPCRSAGGPLLRPPQVLFRSRKVCSASAAARRAVPPLGAVRHISARSAAPRFPASTKRSPASSNIRRRRSLLVLSQFQRYHQQVGLLHCNHLLTYVFLACLVLRKFF